MFSISRNSNQAKTVHVHLVRFFREGFPCNASSTYWRARFISRYVSLVHCSGIHSGDCTLSKMAEPCFLYSLVCRIVMRLYSVSISVHSSGCVYSFERQSISEQQSGASEHDDNAVLLISVEGNLCFHVDGFYRVFKNSSARTAYCRRVASCTC